MPAFGDPAYTPFYCEENIWLLAQRADLIVGRAEVVLVGGASPGRAQPDGLGHGARVACWLQRAAEPREAVLWDYHVVLAEHAADGLRVWDLDTRLPCPCDAALWVAGTFQDPAMAPARFHPRFRVVDAATFVRDFASDRSHMRDARGRWLKPPPPWPAPWPPGATRANLDEWLATAPGGPGVVLDRAGLEAAWGISDRARRPGSA